jgi:hypothetical protein
MDTVTGLWFHGWEFTPEKVTVGHNFAKALWARGNCWITISIPLFIELARPDVRRARSSEEVLGQHVQETGGRAVEGAGKGVGDVEHVVGRPGELRGDKRYGRVCCRDLHGVETGTFGYRRLMPSACYSPFATHCRRA